MPLQYNVSQLLKSDVGATRAYDFDSDAPLDLDGAVATDITGCVKFTLTNFSVLACAEARATLHLTCARCLDPYESPVDITFDEEYQPTIDIFSGLPSTGPRNDAAFVITANHTIDLTEALRQNLLLAVELIPLCSEACKGLCASCGANLNTETCACPPVQETSPFAALQGLLSGPQARE